MSFSFSLNRPERGAFQASAICWQGVVRVRMRGRLARTETLETHKIQVNDHASDRSLPVLRISRAGQLETGCLKRMYSIALGIRSFFSTGEGKNFVGAFLAPRNLSALVQPAKQSSCRLTKCLEVLSCLVSHELKHGAKNDGKIPKGFGEFPNV